MLVSDTIRVLRNGKKYETATITIMSENSSSGKNDDVDSESETRIPTQEDVNEQMRSCIVPLTKQLEDWIRLVQKMSSAHQPNIYRRAGITACFSAAGHLADK